MAEENKEVEVKEEPNTGSTVEHKDDNSAVDTAYKELYDAQKIELEKLQKELTDVKVANAKLAIQSSAREPLESPEEILNKMF